MSRLQGSKQNSGPPNTTGRTTAASCGVPSLAPIPVAPWLFVTHMQGDSTYYIVQFNPGLDNGEHEYNKERFQVYLKVA